jgi:hypothetical protein
MFTTSQEISCLLRNPKVHNCVDNSPPLDSILKQKNPVHIFPTCFSKIHSNIILPSLPRSSQCSSIQVPPPPKKKLLAFLISHACYLHCSSHPPPKVIPILSSYLCLGLPSDLLPSGFTPPKKKKLLESFKHATSTTHHTHHLTTLIIFAIYSSLLLLPPS